MPLEQYIVDPKQPFVNVKVVAFGNMGCFTPPQFKPENYTLGFMTPTAARGVLDGISMDKFEHNGKLLPTYRNVVTRITAIQHPDPRLRVRQNQIERITMNGVRAKTSFNKGTFIRPPADDNIQRSISILHAPAFLIEGKISLLPIFTQYGRSTGKNIKAYQEIFERRVKKGFTYRPVYMGLSRFLAQIKPYENEEVLSGLNLELGPLIYDYIFDEDTGKLAYRRYFNAVVKDSVLNCDWFSGEIKLIVESEERIG